MTCLEGGVVSSNDLGGFAELFSIQSRVGSSGRWYSHETNPRAKKFFDLSASRGLIPSISLQTSFVNEVIGT